MLATRADGADAKALREVADQLRDKLGSGVIVLAGVEGDKIALVAMVTPDLVGKLNAGKIVGEVAKAVGGKGGGRPDMAQGGGVRAAEPRRGAGPRVRPRSWLRPRRTFVIGAEDAGATVAAALRRQLVGECLAPPSWAQVRRLCTTGKVFVDDERALDPARRLRAGQTVAINVAAPRPDQTPARLPHRVRRRPPGGDRQAVRASPASRSTARRPGPRWT